MTKILFDTNVLIWYFWGRDRVIPIKELIESIDSEVYISSVSLWEIAMKIRAGKLSINFEELHSYILRHRFRELPMSSKYMKTYLELPSLHKDPFDLMLIAQALSCPMRLITGDAILREYSSLVMVI